MSFRSTQAPMPLAKLSLRGAGVPAIAAALGGAQLAQPGRVAWLDANDRCLACRLTDEHLLLLAASTSAAELQQRVTNAPVVEHDVTFGLAGFGLRGPRHETVLQRLTKLDVSSAALPEGRCAETGVAGIHALLIRPPRPKVPSTLIYVSWDLSEYAQETLTKAAAEPEVIGPDTWREVLGS